jgi:hypothetical protein
MKAVLAVLVVALALAAAAAPKQFLSEVEYSDAGVQSHPSLVPHYFLEHAAAFPGGKKISSAVKKGVKGVKSGAKRIAKAAAKTAKKLAKKLGKLAKLAKNGDKRAAKKLKKTQKKLSKVAKKAGGAAGRAANAAARKAKKLAKKALKKGKKAAAAAKKAAAKNSKQQAKTQDKLLNSNKKTDKRVKQATEKLHHVASSMSSLNGLLKRVHRNVERLVPGNRIRQYAAEDGSAISQSKLGTLGKKEENTLVNPHNKKQSGKALYGKKVIPKDTKVIKKGDDMSAQNLALKQKNLSKFTHKLAKKDKISLV